MPVGRRQAALERNLTCEQTVDALALAAAEGVGCAAERYEMSVLDFARKTGLALDPADASRANALKMRGTKRAQVLVVRHADRR